MKPGDKVKVSLCSIDWQNSDRDTVYVFIDENAGDGGHARICRVGDIRYAYLRNLFPVAHCKECGQELPERK